MTNRTPAARKTRFALTLDGVDMGIFSARGRREFVARFGDRVSTVRVIAAA